MLHGAIPNRDFLHLYGPGSLWALAGVFKVFGVSLLTERLFGLAPATRDRVRHLRARAPVGPDRSRSPARSRRRSIIIPFGLTALAWVGGVGLGVLRPRGRPRGARPRADDRRRARAGGRSTAGVLLGVAVLFRLDLVLARRPLDRSRSCGACDRRACKRLLAGLRDRCRSVRRSTSRPRARAHVSQGMVLDPVFHLRGGRSLPIPPPWSHVDGFLQKAGRSQQLHVARSRRSRASQQLFLWFFLLLGVIAFVLVAGLARGARRTATRSAPARCSSSALFGLGILPQALQRVDSAHFAWVSCVAVRRSCRSRSSSSRAARAPAGRAAPARARGRARSCSRS